MQHDIPRLTQTKTGVYGYRRKIKQEHRYLFEGKREIVKSFKTKDLRHAMRQHREMDKWFDNVLASDGVGLKLDPKLAPKEKVIEVVKDLYNRRLHPSDLPSLTALDSLQKLQSFVEEVQNISEIYYAFQDGKLSKQEYEEEFDAEGAKGNKFFQLLSYKAEIENLRNKLNKRYSEPSKRGLMSKPEEWPVGRSEIPKDELPTLLPWDNNDPDVIKFKIMTGDLDVTPDPTWSNAMYSYLKENMQKTRNAANKYKHQNSVISLCQRLSAVLPKGMETKLSDLDFDVLKPFMFDTWPNASTRQRNLRIYQAVVNNWNNLNQAQEVINPFTRMVSANHKLIEGDSKVRRSFTPEEHEIFLANLLECKEPEIKIIGLIMLTYGTPTEEAAILARDDVKLKSATPHLLIRKNKFRILGKKRLERAVPIIEPLLSHLRDYIDNHYTGTDLLFPRFGQGNHASGDRSKKLKSLIVNKRPNDDALLSPYSLRHTFKDKYKAAKVNQDIGEYIMGHKSADSNRIHDKYGTGNEIEGLVEDITAITNVKTWGYFEEFDT